MVVGLDLEGVLVSPGSADFEGLSQELAGLLSFSVAWARLFLLALSRVLSYHHLCPAVGFSPDCQTPETNICDLFLFIHLQYILLNCELEASFMLIQQLSV